MGFEKQQNKSKSSHHYLKWTLLSILVGCLAGLVTSIFLTSLNWVTETRGANPHLIFLLPVAGLLIGWAYDRYGSSFSGGSNLVIDQIHDPQKTLPLRMTPFVFFGTLLTHLFGGSAGREGTAVQMGASLAHQIHRFIPMEKEEQRILLVAGAGAGFGAAVGAPWAGMIFGMEVMNIGRLRLFAWFECLIASFTGYYVVNLTGAKHSVYPAVDIPSFKISILSWVILAGILFGGTGLVFSRLAHFVEKLQRRFVQTPCLRPFFGGILLVAFFWLDGSFRYTGLGIPVIQEALTSISSFKDPALKTFFTALTVGSGFKGGEFIPLVFIGTTLGSALSLILPVSFQLLGALGFAAVFAGAANTPIACTLMAMELFGFKIGIYAFGACFSAYYFSGHRGIYHAQKISHKKHHDLFYFLKFFR